MRSKEVLSTDHGLPGDTQVLPGGSIAGLISNRRRVSLCHFRSGSEEFHVLLLFLDNALVLASLEVRKNSDIAAIELLIISTQ